jgi:hypothetical protein
MYKWFTLGLAAMAALFLTSRIIWAGEETRIAAAEHIVTQTLAPTKKLSKRAAALEVAAELGVFDAQLKLARMYSAGEDVPLNDTKAFELYHRIVDDHADVRPHHARAGGVAHAFVALGNYYRTGIPGSTVRIDKRRAASLLWHAASYLGDAEAQCNLAQMYLDGEGVPRNEHLAVNWLTNAAKKRHGKSQAILGNLLWHGAKEVRRQPLKGLALLSLARQNARDDDEARWIDDLYTDAYAASQANERERAAKLAARWQARMGRKGFNVVVPEQANAEPAPANKAGPVQESGIAAGFTNVGMDGQSTLR